MAAVGVVSRRDVVYAFAIGLAALALDLLTLHRDFGGHEDQPKFQFLGYVLGTAHPPGYPLYVLLSHIFVMLPIGTVAYRANLFSAAMAACASGLSYLIARQIGATRWPAAGAAVGLATGASFWLSAVFAEVYSLAAVMAALTVVLLLAWGARGGAVLLLAAVAAFGLGLGNHLTILGLLPPSIVYVLLRNRRVLTVRVVAAIVAILLVGVSQYAFIVLRTIQAAPYLESQATSLPALVDIVTARHFADRRFAFNAATVLTVHLPRMLSVIAQELGPIGVPLLLVGLIAALRRRSGAAALVAGAAVGMLAMMVNVLGDLQGFVTPVMVLVWPFTALAIDAVRQAVDSPRFVRLVVGAVAMAAPALIPVANVSANYKRTDQSEQTESGRFFRSLYAHLPDRAAIVAEDYFVDMALRYFEATHEGGPARGITRIGFGTGAVREAKRSGRRVFAFGRAAAYFAAEGFSFERAVLVGQPIDQWLNGLPRDTVIAGAAANAAVPLVLSPIARRGLGAERHTRTFAVFVRAAGRSSEAWRDSDTGLSLAVESNTLPAPLPQFPGALRVFADDRGARIELADRTIADVDSGLALAVFRPDGTLWRALEFRSGEPLDVAAEAAFYELTGESPCVNVARDEWADADRAFATGSAVATVPLIGTTVMEIETSGSCGSSARLSELFGAGTIRTVSRSSNADGSVTFAAELTRAPVGRPLFRFALDCPPPHARARVVSGGESSVTMCADRPLALFPGTTDHALVRPDFDSESYFGAGWHNVERTPTGRIRRADDRATLLLPLSPAYNYRMRLDFVAAAGTSIGVGLNGTVLGTCELRDRVPCDVTASSDIVHEGVNSLTVSAPGSNQTGQASAGLVFQGAQVERRRVEDRTPR